MCAFSSQTGEGANEDTPTLQLAEYPVYLEPSPEPNRDVASGKGRGFTERRKGKLLMEKEIPFRTSRKGNGEFNSHEVNEQNSSECQA
jgi:hypothetical protein